MTKEGGDLPANLRTAQIPLVSPARCKAALAGKFGVYEKVSSAAGGIQETIRN